MQTNTLFQLAVCSYGLDTHLSIDAFIKKVTRFIEMASTQKVDAILFPELFVADLLPGFPPQKIWEISELRQEQKQFEQIARNCTPVILKKLQEIAIQNKITIVAGSLPRLSPHSSDQGNTPGNTREVKILNSCPIIFPNGQLIFQDKIFLTRHEKSPWGWTRGESIRFFNIPTRTGELIKAVVNICFDVEFPLVSQMLVNYAPELILVPSCTSADYGFKRVRWCAQARSIEHYAFVASTGTVGSIPTPGFDANEGQAVILSPSEEGFRSPLAEGIKNQPDLIIASLDIGYLRKKRLETSVFPASQQLKLNPLLKTEFHN